MAVTAKWKLIRVIDGNEQFSALSKQVAGHLAKHAMSFPGEYIDYQTMVIHRQRGSPGVRGTGPDACCFTATPIPNGTDFTYKQCEYHMNKPSRREIQGSLTGQEMAREISKGANSDPDYFYPNENAYEADFFILVGANVDLSKIRGEQVYLCFPHNQQCGITKSCRSPGTFSWGVSNYPATLDTISWWINRYTEYHIPDGTPAPAIQQTVSGISTSAVTACTDKKYAVGTNLYIAPEICQETGIKTTCVIMESPGYRRVVSIEYLNHKAKQMQP